MISFVRLSAGAAGLASLLLLAGCDTHHNRIVAEVNGDTIAEDDYNSRVQSVTTIPENVGTDAGGMTMVNMIRDRLTDQLAKKLDAVPSEDAVDAAVQYQLRMDPVTNAGISAGKLTKEDLKRQKKYELEAFGIGTNGDKPSEQAIDKAYEEYKDKPEFLYKALYVVRIIQVPDDATGRRVITELKQTGDFKAVAQKYLGMPPSAAENANKDQTLVSDQLRPELKEALDRLKPNEITPEPVAIKLANPQQPAASQTVYAVAQLKSKEPEHVLTRSEAKYFLVPIVLQKTHPDWKDHYRMELSDFTKKSQIRIALQKYEGLVDTYIRPIAMAESSARPAAGLPAGHPAMPQ